MGTAQLYNHPGLYLNVIPPQIPVLNGVPFNIGAIVGSASFGPVNQAVDFANYQAGVAIFGTPNARKYDLMTPVFTSQLQGSAGSYIGVRVTDGTDVAASGTLGNNGSSSFWAAVAAAINSGTGVARGPSNFITATATSTGISISAKYTGSFGNNISAQILQGSQAGSYRIAVAAPNIQSEVFDSIGAAIAAAVAATGSIAFTLNPAASSTIVLNGTTVTFETSGATGDQVNIGATLAQTLANLLVFLQGSSDTQLVKFTYALAGTTLNLTAATAGTGGNSLTTVATVSGATASGATLSGGVAAMTAPTLSASVTLSGGTDGATSITKSILLGSDVYPRTGMYALRAQGANYAMLADLDDVTAHSVQATFGASENIFMVVTTPAGDTISNASAQKIANSIDTYFLKYLVGDWVTFNDTVNNTQRQISPQSWYMGVKMQYGPHESALNKPVYGIVSTQMSAANLNYAGPDLATIYANGMDVIANPSAGNQAYFSCQTGRNASSNTNTRGENYSTMTNYIAATVQKGMGQFVGQLQSLRTDDLTRRQAKATLDSFLGQLADEQLHNPPMLDDFQTVLDTSNNTSTTIPGGFMFAYVKAVYMSVVEFFVINLEGGQNVQIVRSGATSANQSGSAATAQAGASFLAGGGSGF